VAARVVTAKSILDQVRIWWFSWVSSDHFGTLATEVPDLPSFVTRRWQNTIRLGYPREWRLRNCPHDPQAVQEKEPTPYVKAEGTPTRRHTLRSEGGGFPDTSGVRVRRRPPREEDRKAGRRMPKELSLHQTPAIPASETQETGYAPVWLVQYPEKAS
jgi:hypothetical protein